MSGQGTLLPFYAICDVSASMRESERVDALNEAVAATCDAVAINPVVADRIRLSIISFSTEAEVDLPLCDLGMLDRIPRLRPRGLTSYAAAFRRLRTVIEDDVAQLVADGYRVFRPAAFFLTDGRPTDRNADWRAAHADLVDADFPHRPNVVSFGLGDADHAVLTEVATVASYAASDAVTAATAIASFGTLLVESVVASGAAGHFRLPAELPTSLVELDGDLL
ncbi:MAG: VWA domain-containing protein [Actinomycetota bacterium]|nr:VWA domain-containing protein [Actinomycetota bacterium]